ncbi:hypothetical protein R6Q59_035684 [Mikania micrantha]|uniref:Cytochrome P450 n=1 Tax=Mikania micrantha TaxID=192012 RepID=A0A5N6NDH1_9ASTR|nr:hypothetical protein E3N88_23512 [Mikania micrantha]
MCDWAFGRFRVCPNLSDTSSNDGTLENCPQLLEGKYLGYNYTSLVFAPYGDHWRNLKHVASTEILLSHRLREFEPIRANEGCIMLRILYRAFEKSTVFLVKPMLVDLTLKDVMKMISGKRYYYSKNDVVTDEEKEKAHRFQEIVS